MATVKQSWEPMDTFVFYIPGTDRSQIDTLATLPSLPVALSASHGHSRREAYPQRCVLRTQGSASGDSQTTGEV